MKIATWNVNSIRSRIPNFKDWIEKDQPDIVLLQELKCLNEQFPYLELDDLGYNIEVIGEKGRNGVAICSKYKMYNVKKQLPLYNIVKMDDSARYIEAYIDYNKYPIKIASIYLPNGGPTVLDEKHGYDSITKTDSFINKMLFSDRLKIEFEQSIKNNEIAFYGGDYNVCANLNMDVYSTTKDGTITNTQLERDKFKEFLDVGMIDIWREKNPNLKEYSWWGYRPFSMFEKNQGYRLDAILITPQTQTLIKQCYINKTIREQEKPSDHAPMICEIE